MRRRGRERQMDNYAAVKELVLSLFANGDLDADQAGPIVDALNAAAKLQSQLEMVRAVVAAAHKLLAVHIDNRAELHQRLVALSSTLAAYEAAQKAASDASP